MYGWLALRRSALTILVLVLVLPLSTAAQTTTGVIDGTVRDPNNLPVPGVAITANSQALIQRDLTVVSDDLGYYRLPLLPPGRYDVRYALQGFRELDRSGLIVAAGQTTTIDVPLELAAVQEVATVVGESPSLDQRGAKLAFSYTAELMENIPAERTTHGLFETIPGVESANLLGAQQPGTIEVQNVLGAGERANSYRFDGANTTGPAAQWNLQGLFPVDVIEEVQVVKSAKPAEIPFQGALFHVITKSGGNEFHGTVGGYFQNDSLESDNSQALLAASGSNTSNRLKDEYEATASMGGKFIEDKLWWYGSVRRLSGTSTVFNFPKDITNEINAFFWKNTYQANANHRFSGFATRFNQDVSHYFFSLDPTFSPALAGDEFAASERPVSGSTASISWDGVLTDRVLAEASVSRSTEAFDQTPRPGAGVAVIDLVTGVRTKNTGEGSRDQDNDSVALAGSVSWFVPDAGGRHDIKAGFEYLPTRSRIVFDDIGNHRLNTVFGAPRIVRIISTPSTAIWDNDLTSAYVQDSWTLQDRLTLNFGVRFEHTNASAPAQQSGGGAFAGTALANRFPALNAQTLAPTEFVNWNNVAPRFAATYAVDEGGTTVLRFGASRYHHNLASFDLFVANPAFPFTYGTLWFDRNGDRAFQVGEDGPLLFQFGGQINPVDPDLEHPYTTEFVAGISHEPFADTSFSVTAIYRKDRKVAATQDTGVPTEQAYSPVTVTDPGPDGVIGTGDDATITAFARNLSTVPDSIITITNPAGNERTYAGVEVVASKRFSNNWQAVASLVVSEMEVFRPTGVNSTPNLFDNPNGLINAKGKDPYNETVQFKLQGTYTAPWDVYLSAFYKYGSGYPYTRVLTVQDLPQGAFDILAEPRGSSTNDATNKLDLRLEKRFVMDGVQVGFIADVFNLTNSATVLSYGVRTGIDYMEPAAIVNPRNLRLGGRITW